MNVLKAKQSQVALLFGELHDKSREALPQIVERINSVLEFDGHLLQFFVTQYPLPVQIRQEVRLEQVRELLQFYCEHLEEIQQAIIDKEDGGTLGSLVGVAPGNVNYKLNRYNIGRFLREKSEHYQHCLQQHCKLVDEERTLGSEAALPFLRELFTGNGFQLNLESGRSQPFFTSAASESSMKRLLEDYNTKVKQMPAGSSQEMWIPQEDILDLIECWIRLDGRLVTSYQPKKSRKEERKQQLINGAFQEPQTNYIPERIVEEETKQEQPPPSTQRQPPVQNETSGAPVLSSHSPKVVNRKLSEIELSVMQTINKYEAMLTRNPSQSQRVIIVNTILSLDKQLKLYNQQKLQANGQHSLVLSPSRVIGHDVNFNSTTVGSTPQTVASKLQEIFYVYCRKRYTLSKHTTFDDIEHQTRTMNFEKFYNICHDFGLVQEAEREALRWSFKKYAKNLSEIDYTRFGKILAELFAQDTKKKELFEHRICQFKNDWSLSNKPSLEQIKYEFKIIPHSGKTQDEIRQELQHRRQVKSTHRQQHHIRRVKVEVQYLKKMGLNRQAVEVINRTNKKSSPSFNLDYLLPVQKQPEKLTISNLDKFKDKNFNPRTFVDDRQDQYLKDYRLPQPTQYRGMARRLSQTRVRDLDHSERSRQQTIMEGIERNLNNKVTRGLRAVNRPRNQ